MVADGTLTASFSQQIADIGQQGWDACAGTANPFVCFDFLHALERSGSAAAETGWQPYHIAVTGGDDDATGPLAVMPLYVKNHSYGEYVFDHAWANAYERAGGAYYPKLQSSVPFSPVTGPRLLVRDREGITDDGTALLKSGLFGAGADLTDRLGLSSLHITFMTPEDASAAEAGGYLIRHDQQFHWRNRNFTSFDDFLASLSSRKRKQIRKERRTVADSGVTIRALTGSDISEAHWDHFFACYQDTGARKWGAPYLNRAFFSLIGESMAGRILLIQCELDGRPIASALNFIGTDTLYGRYWGCLEDVPCLHFEACYYRAIDFAIAHGLAFVEAGAQGPHKVARGYEPVKTYSAHYLRDPSFRDAVARFLDVERRDIEAEIDYFGDHTPFRKS
jgi:predicted N-acyltransferase